MNRRVSLLAIGLGLLAGCTAGTFVPSPAVVNITGDWTGKCTGSGCIETDIYLRLTQDRDTVDGTFSAGGRSPYSRPRPVLKGWWRNGSSPSRSVATAATSCSSTSRSTPTPTP